MTTKNTDKMIDRIIDSLETRLNTWEASWDYWWPHKTLMALHHPIGIKLRLSLRTEFEPPRIDVYIKMPPGNRKEELLYLFHEGEQEKLVEAYKKAAERLKAENVIKLREHDNELRLILNEKTKYI